MLSVNESIEIVHYVHGVGGAETGLRYWPQLQAIEIKLIGSLTTAENIAIHNAGLVQLAEKQAKSWLVDARTVSGFSEEFEQYMAEVWMKRAMEIGVHSMAVVVAEEAISAVAVESTNAQILEANNAQSLGYELLTFGDMDAAIGWLSGRVGLNHLN